MEKQQNSEKINTLAAQILNFTRDSLLVNLRFLDAALSRLEVTSYGGTYASDGIRLFYDPVHMLRSYKEEKNSPSRDFLHCVLHCVFGHIFTPDYVKSRKEKTIWDLSCDIACEYTISCLDLSFAYCKRQQRQQKVFDSLLGPGCVMTAEKIYKYYIKAGPEEEDIKFLEDTFHTDDHEKWPGNDEALKASWLNVSHRMQVDMETFTRRQGSKAAALLSNLKEVNRITSDYAGFLSKFASKGDGLKLDPDEFDYSLYSYGMQLSGGKVPFIEQLEYKDSMRVRDIVLAVFAGDLLTVEKVKLFILNTRTILDRTQTFCSSVRLHVIFPEDDAYHLITNSEEAAALAEELTSAKSSDYDFRTAFNKVTELSRKHTFKNLRGLLVLTDNEGTFPSHMPSFPGAFIFINDDYTTLPVPAWAIRLTLQSDEI